MATTQTLSADPTTGREPGDIVTAQILGRDVPGEIVEDAGLTAEYGPGPTRLWVVDVPGAGTYRVPETDITAPT